MPASRPSRRRDLSKNKRHVVGGDALADTRKSKQRRRDTLVGFLLPMTSSAGQYNRGNVASANGVIGDMASANGVVGRIAVTAAITIGVSWVAVTGIGRSITIRGVAETGPITRAITRVVAVSGRIRIARPRWRRNQSGPAPPSQTSLSLSRTCAYHNGSSHQS